ncbi:MAG: glycosyltransferase, partial [Chloroflexota bacterium]
MLTAALASATSALVVLTAFLVFAGRRPTPFADRLLAFAMLVLAPVVPVGASVALIAIAAVGLILPRYWYAVGAWLFAALVVVSGLYAVYLVRATFLLGGDPVSFLLGLVLLLLQTAAIAMVIGSAFEMIDALCAPPVDPARPPDPERWPVVCLQVPTYNEPPDLVLETIASLIAVDYPALRVQVIDNNTTDPALWEPVNAECARLRAAGHAVDFVHLPEWPGFKGGALNWGLAHLPPDVEIVGVVDADYVVDARWLRDAIPHFNDPAVAFVQSPQDYRAWEDSGFYRACYVGFGYF